MTALRVGLAVVACIALPAVTAGALTMALVDWVTRRADRSFDARIAEVGDEAESWVHALYHREMA